MASWESDPWEEQHRLRIGTGADGCIDRLLRFACAGSSMEQWSSEGRVVSRVVDLEDAALMADLGKVMDYCGQVFGGTADVVTDLFGFGACDDKGDLWGDDIIVTDERWHTPEDSTSGTCE